MIGYKLKIFIRLFKVKIGFLKRKIKKVVPFSTNLNIFV